MLFIYSYKELQSKLSHPNTPPPVTIIDETVFRRSYPYIQLSTQMQQNLAQLHPIQQQHHHQPYSNVSMIMDPIDMINYQMNNMNISPNTPPPPQLPLQQQQAVQSIQSIEAIQPPPPQLQPQTMLYQPQSHQQRITDMIMPRTNYTNDYYYDRTSSLSAEEYDAMRMQQLQQQQQQQVQPSMYGDSYYRQCDLNDSPVSMIYQQQPKPVNDIYYSDNIIDVDRRSSPPIYLNDRIY